jgi:hypothetical protein
VVCVAACGATALLDVTTTPNSCVNSCALSQFTNYVTTPYSCVSSCPAKLLVDRTSTPASCVTLCRPGLYLDNNTGTPTCVSSCQSSQKINPTTNPKECLSACPSSLPFGKNASQDCIAQCANLEYVSNGTCYTCPSVGCDFMASFEVASTSVVGSQLRVVLNYTNSSAPLNYSQLKMSRIYIEGNRTRRMLAEDLTQVSTYYNSKKVLLVVGQAVNVSGYAYMYIFLEYQGVVYPLPRQSLTNIPNLSLGSLLYAFQGMSLVLLLLFLASQQLGVFYSVLPVWQLGYFMLYSKPALSSAFFN